MGCKCRGRQRAGAVRPDGTTILGYKVTFPASANREPETFLTKLEAERARRTAGGGTIEQLT